MLHVLPTTRASVSRGTGSEAAKITASTRSIHSRQRSSGGRSSSSRSKSMSSSGPATPARAMVTRRKPRRTARRQVPG
jgi:hypothetical protein